MKLIKKGAIVLLCGASALLSGCSSKKTVSSINAGVNEKSFVMVEFDLVQTNNVKFDVSFGIVYDHKNITWEQARDTYGIYYFILHMYNENWGKSESTSEDATEVVYLAEDFIVDVSQYSSSQVVEKVFDDDELNYGRPFKAFYVEQTIELEAKRFELKGRPMLFFTVGALDSEHNEILVFGSHAKDAEFECGIICEYGFKGSTVTFNDKYCCAYERHGY